MTKEMQSEPAIRNRVSPSKSRSSGSARLDGVPIGTPFNQMLAQTSFGFMQHAVGNQAINRLIQRTLIIGNDPIDHYEQLEQQDQKKLLLLCGKGIPVQADMFVPLIFGEIAKSPEVFAGTIEELAQFIIEVCGNYMMAGPENLEVLQQGSLAEKIAASIYEGDEKIKALGDQLQAPSLSSVDRGNALALSGLMEEYPDFKGQFGKHKAIKSLNFNSNKAKGIGGKYSRDDRSIDISTLVGQESESVFLRTLIHEIGHATFQQLLLKDKLSTDVSKGEHGDLVAAQEETTQQIETLSNAPFQGNKRQMGPNSELYEQAQQMGALMSQEDHLKQEIAKFSDDGLVYYNAWLVLRQNNGQYMLGVDLGKVSNAEGRKPYQAEKFEEFCAESFMHIVKEPTLLTSHIEQLSQLDDTPPAVIQAWHTVVMMLEKYKPMIVGERAI